MSPEGRPPRSPSSSPVEEAVRVIPSLGRIEVEALQPPLLAAGRTRRRAEAGQHWRGPADAHVPHQTREQERGAPEGALDIHRPLRVELPRRELAEDDVTVFRLCINAVPERKMLLAATDHRPPPITPRPCAPAPQPSRTI